MSGLDFPVLASISLMAVATHACEIPPGPRVLVCAVVFIWSSSAFSWKIRKHALVAAIVAGICTGDRQPTIVMDYFQPAGGLHAKLSWVTFEKQFMRFNEQTWGYIESYLSFNERRWVNAVLRGQIFQLPDEVISWFKMTGLFHLLVVSGFHFAMLLGLVRELGFMSLRICNSLLAWNTRRQYHLALFIRITTAAIGILLLAFLGNTPPAQRAFCCFVASVILLPQSVRYGFGQRIEMSAALHALFFPAGILSKSGILSWLIYASVVGGFSGFKGIVLAQARIFVVVAVMFSQLNWAALFLNLLFASGLGTAMLVTGCMPPISIWLRLDEVRYWNMLAVDSILRIVRYTSEAVVENSDWLSYSLSKGVRWALLVCWCGILLRRFSKSLRNV